MPWNEVSIMSAREEFVRLAMQPEANKSELCRRFGISRPTADKWIERFRAQGKAGLADRSRRPHRMPERTAAQIEEAIVALRREHPAWGARTLKARLQAKGHKDLPAAVSTIQAILQRHQLINEQDGDKHKAFKRFERDKPNELWQMDFKGHVPLSTGGRCHPLTVLDDHSRFNVCLKALGNEQTLSVQDALSHSFRCYGLPQRIITDNGAPWGDTPEHPYTRLGVWLIRLGISLSHSRPYHPQTLGKDERFHRTLKAEVLAREPLIDLPHAQRRFDAWRAIYNLERPHHALAMQAPVSRYQSSPRPFPEQLPAVDYPEGATVRRVQYGGELCYLGKVYRVSKALHGHPVALQPNLEHDGLLEVYFCHQRIATINLHDKELTQV
jgi:transposase InsO family protein